MSDQDQARLQAAIEVAQTRALAATARALALRSDPATHPAAAHAAATDADLWASRLHAARLALARRLRLERPGG